ncbi:unnamed protein product [Coffea canephora]|uniref:PHD-type domain-containing protein n=1 Tax=Coffea canephora TaxID=49390 RepID=A0A068TQJ6_COFCA|nr:unnamed protein product [Coffea canephora]
MATDCQEDSDSENPTKRTKTQSPTPENSSPPSLFSSKGKTKLQLETNCCGICLSEAARDDNSVSRGYIDSCDHYFCFVCIMEWAKVESKCPLCKRRFSTIRRPAKPPILPADRLVHVPVRDQVYYYGGNATVGPLDPYSEVKCSVCQSSVDDSLLLLCDLCDSAAHTYCVGLGATVPEGDWFCHDCTLLRDERNKSEIDSVNNNNDGNPPSYEHVSIFDVVREPKTRCVGRSSESCLSVDQVRDLETTLGDNVNVLDSRRQTDIMQGAVQLTGRTLSRCRNVHNRIQALRDNWNSFRSGSLSFSSGKRNYRCSADRKPEIGVDSVQPSSTSSLSLKSRLDDSNPGASQNKDSPEIDRAWKMLDMAKSIEKRKSTSCQSSKFTRYKYHSSDSKQRSSENLGGFKKEQRQDCHSVWKDSNKHKPLMVERQNCHDQGFGNDGIGFAIAPLPLYYQLITSQDVRCPVQHDVPRGNGKKPYEKISLGSTFTVSDSCSRPICTGSPVEPAPVSSNLVCPSVELNFPSSCKKEPWVQKGERQKFPADSKAKENYDAKSEIQSLVKLNLKLLTKDKNLEANVFKEVARLATHTILGACGLEQPKHGIHPSQSSVCSHEKGNQHFRKSTLMPNSCRECFYVFVKDVVSAIMYERIRHVNT